MNEPWTGHTSEGVPAVKEAIALEFPGWYVELSEDGTHIEVNLSRPDGKRWGVRCSSHGKGIAGVGAKYLIAILHEYRQQIAEWVA